MSRRTGTPSLTRLFDRCPDPVYVIDARRRIAYANDALFAWTGLSREDLMGRAVQYHAHDDHAAPSGIAKALCPPPTAFAGHFSVGHVSCLRKDGHLVYRRAHFFPLGRAEAARTAQPGAAAAEVEETRCVGVVALLEPHDLAADDLERDASREPGFQDLHRAVAELRRRRAVRGAGVAVVGTSELVRRVRRQMELAAQTRSPVLVVGPDAWQRRRVAEAIPYVRKSAANEAVIPLESKLLDENLLSWSLESLADRGRERLTILLHDVHELPATAQAFLAERIGRWPDEWRVLATSAAIAPAEEDSPRLDSRLFHWLSTLEISLPPLSERMEDLPLVCQYLVEELNAAGTRQIAGFSPAALDRLHVFDWPGGLVQLREVVELAHAAAKSPEISPADLPAFLVQAEAAAAFPPDEPEPIMLESLLAELETSLIQRALELADGNKTRAAALLGMTRPRLYRRLEQLGIE